MNYASINKKIRNAEWPAVKAPARHNIDKAKKWCREYASDGRFYYHYTNTRWWFEREEDAIMFALIWLGGSNDR